METDMKAVYFQDFGGSENIIFHDVDAPADPTGHEVLVNVKAAGVNRADIMQRKGFYPAPKGFPERIPGLEFAGEIAAVGEKVSQFEVGERVFGITAGGAHAEMLLTEESLLAKIPSNLSFVEAAAFPEAFINAHDAVFTQGKLIENETLLIHAVGSGVGLAALQLAKAKGIFVIGTSRTDEKLADAKTLGLDIAISTNNARDFQDQIMEVTKGKGVNVILDLVGASYFSQNIESLALKGRLILVGLVGGRKTEFDLGLALTKRLTIIGTVLRSRTTQEKSSATRSFVREVLPLMASGVLRSNIDRTFPAEDAAGAHDYIESNANFGKVVLEF